MPDGSGGTKELELEDLISFTHFETIASSPSSQPLGIPQPPTPRTPPTVTSPTSALFPSLRPTPTNKSDVTHSVATLYADPQNSTGPRVEVYRTFGTASYVIHDVDAKGKVIGRAVVSGRVKVPDQQMIAGFCKGERGPEKAAEAPEKESDSNPPPRRRSRSSGNLSDVSNEEDSVPALRVSPAMTSPEPLLPLARRFFNPPSFGVTVLGNSHGFDPRGSTSGYVLWLNGRGVMIDPPPFATTTLEQEVRETSPFPPISERARFDDFRDRFSQGSTLRPFLIDAAGLERKCTKD